MAEQGAKPVGTVAVALAHASRLLTASPRLAQAQAEQILDVAPGHPEAIMILALARRADGDAMGACGVLRGLTASQPNWALAHHELGLTLAGLGDGAAAQAALRRAVALKPDMAEAWRALGDQLMIAGDTAGADQAYAQHIRTSVGDPALMEAAVALCDGRLDVAERGLRERLKAWPTDVAAIRMLAELGTRLGRYADAEALLTRCLELAPSFEGARHNHAVVLYRQGKSAEALKQIEALLQLQPTNPSYRNLRAAALATLGEYSESIRTYEAMLADYPDQPKGWLSYGHALRTAGRRADTERAYRRCIEMAPGFGEAYWSLANLKTLRFSDAEVDAMRDQLERAELGGAELGDEDRLHLHYALGKALEDARMFDASFDQYARGASIRRRLTPYDGAETTAQIQRAISFFTREVLTSRSGAGDPAPDPIFVVGLPRSGSTLIEQILSSHSAVEGTIELPDITNIAKSLGQHRSRDRTATYPGVLADLDRSALRDLGAGYISDTRVHRKTAKPHFIDKMPNNFLHLGMISLILPNAKIIDARRHPLATCFSGFKQHFAKGQNFSYDLRDIGRYYRDYVELMAHFDRVLPGRVHRVFYEEMVQDTEHQVRRLLDYCGLAFEPACLRFHENDRAVRTASSEQVRQPIFRDGLDQWRNYEPWLDPLKAALGPVLDAYPATPQALGAAARLREPELAV